MKTAVRSPMQSVTAVLVVVIVMSLGFAAVSIAYAAGRQSHTSVWTRSSSSHDWPGRHPRAADATPGIAVRSSR